MAHTELTLSTLATPADPARVVALAPGLGTAVTGTWDVAAEHLAADSYVIAVDLPGHGRSPAWDAEKTQPSIASLAQAVEAAIQAELERAGLQHLPVHFAGISLGGALALQLALEHAETFTSSAMICSAAKIGQQEAWADRAAAVRAGGTAQLVDGSMARWFAPGSPEANPRRVQPLFIALTEADPESYALLCRSLGDFDLTDRLHEVTIALLVIAGEHDTVAPPQQAEDIGAAVTDSQVHVLSDAAHQAPTEKPAETARLLNDFFA